MRHLRTISVLASLSLSLAGCAVPTVEESSSSEEAMRAAEGADTPCVPGTRFKTTELVHARYTTDASRTTVLRGGKWATLELPPVVLGMPSSSIFVDVGVLGQYGYTSASVASTDWMLCGRQLRISPKARLDLNTGFGEDHATWESTRKWMDACNRDGKHCQNTDVCVPGTYAVEKRRDLRSSSDMMMTCQPKDGLVIEVDMTTDNGGPG